MAPFDREVSALEEVRTAFFSGLVIGESETESSSTFIIHFVSGVYIHIPGTERVEACRKGYVKIVSDYEIEPEIPEIETPGRFLSKSRHQKAGSPVRPLRHKSERQSQRYRNIHNHRIGRSENGFLAGFGHHFGSGEFEVVVRMFTVADGIFSISNVYGIVRHHLDVLAVKNSILLLGNYICDARLPGIEIIP